MCFNILSWPTNLYTAFQKNISTGVLTLPRRVPVTGLQIWKMFKKDCRMMSMFRSRWKHFEKFKFIYKVDWSIILWQYHQVEARLSTKGNPTIQHGAPVFGFWTPSLFHRFRKNDKIWQDFISTPWDMLISCGAWTQTLQPVWGLLGDGFFKKKKFNDPRLVDCSELTKFKYPHWN